MTPTFHGPSVLLLLLVPLVVWRIVVRVRRLVTRQALLARRQRFALCFFPALIVLLAIGTLSHPVVLAALAGGVAVGVLLAGAAMARTTFEATPQGLFYTPHAPIGLVVSALFIGRILYRLWQIHVGDGGQGWTLHSPVTLALFGVLAGYYAGHAAGLLRWQRRHAAGAA